MFFIYWATFLVAALTIMWSWDDSHKRTHNVRILHFCLRVSCLLALPTSLFGMFSEICS